MKDRSISDPSQNKGGSMNQKTHDFINNGNLKFLVGVTALVLATIVYVKSQKEIQSVRTEIHYVRMENGLLREALRRCSEN